MNLYNSNYSCIVLKLLSGQCCHDISRSLLIGSENNNLFSLTTGIQNESKPGGKLDLHL